MEDRAKFEEQNFKFLNNPSFAPKFENDATHQRKMEAFLKNREKELAANSRKLEAERVKAERELAKRNSAERLRIEREKEREVNARKREAENVKEARNLSNRKSPQSVTLSASSSDFAESMQTFFVVQEDWISYELDILKVVENPFLFDMREEEVRVFNNSMQKLAILFRKGKAEILQLMGLQDLVQQVRTLAFNWETLKANSAKMKDSSFKEGERNRIEQARRLLAIAMNSGSSVSERQVAYRRALKALSQVLIIPQRALDELESRMPLLAIEP